MQGGIRTWQFLLPASGTRTNQRPSLLIACQHYPEAVVMVGPELPELPIQQTVLWTGGAQTGGVSSCCGRRLFTYSSYSPSHISLKSHLPVAELVGCWPTPTFIKRCCLNAEGRRNHLRQARHVIQDSLFLNSEEAFTKSAHGRSQEKTTRGHLAMGAAGGGGRWRRVPGGLVGDRGRLAPPSRWSSSPTAPRRTDSLPSLSSGLDLFVSLPREALGDNDRSSDAGTNRSSEGILGFNLATIRSCSTGFGSWKPSSFKISNASCSLSSGEQALDVSRIFWTAVDWRIRANNLRSTPFSSAAMAIYSQKALATKSAQVTQDLSTALKAGRFVIQRLIACCTQISRDLPQHNVMRISVMPPRHVAIQNICQNPKCSAWNSPTSW